MRPPKGQEVTASGGQRVRLARPFDFLVVADHSDGFGFFPLLFKGDAKILISLRSPGIRSLESLKPNGKSVGVSGLTCAS